MDKTREGSFQCVVISLKEEFYCHADALIGIYSQVSIVGGGDVVYLCGMCLLLLACVF